MEITTFAKTVRILLVVLMLGLVPAAFAAKAIDNAAPAGDTPAAKTEVVTTASAQKPAALYYAIAIAIVGGCMSAGYAVGKVGSAVMGAAAEKPEVIGKAIAFVAMGEGIALFGFLVALFLWTKI